MALSNLEKVKARLARIPANVKAAASEQLDANVEDLVSAMKRAAEASIGAGRDPHDEKLTGELVAKIRAEPNPRRELSKTVICDPVDEKGHGYGPNREFGHMTPEGKQVPAYPFFFPTYRALKKPMRAKMMSVSRKAFKAEFSKG